MSHRLAVSWQVALVLTLGLLGLAACGGGGAGGGPEGNASPPPVAPLPTISVDDTRATERDGAKLSFGVTLSAASDRAISARYAVRAGSAKSGRDFVAASGNVEFAAGQTRREIEVALLDDPLHEGDESVLVELSELSAGVQPGRVAATGTIVDDELARRFERFEVEVDLPQDYANPFDPDEVDLELQVTRPDGRTAFVPAFHYREFEVVATAPERYGRGGPPHWRARYTPELAGTHRYRFVLRDLAGSRPVGTELAFEVAQGSARGFVRVDPRDGRFLRHDDGSPFVPIGHNVAWEDGSGLGTAFWETTFGRMGAAGENWTRVHLVHYHEGQSLEWIPNQTGYYHGVGRYSLELAWKIDRIVRAAERHGIAIQLVLINNVILNSVLTPQWQDNPYNARHPGGFLDQPQQFFTDPRARKMFKRLLRYLVARYAYSPAILAWELVNETYLVDGFEISAQVRADVIDWHREMSEYLRAIDPARHPITTGSADDARLDPLWSLPAMDLVQFHNYRPRQLAEFERDILRLQHLGKPILIGEFGAADQQAETRAASMPEPERTQLLGGLGLHNGIWQASLLNSGAMLWWWDRYIDALDLYAHFTPLARFWAGEDPAAQGLARAAVEVRGGPRSDTTTARPGIEDFWASSWQRQFTVAADGSVPGIERLSVWLQGRGHEARRTDPMFTVTLLNPGRFTVAVQGVSPYSAAVQVRVDGSAVFTADYTGAEAPFVIDVPLAAGTHVVQLLNTGADWIRIEHFGFQGLDLPVVTALVQLGTSVGFAWVRDLGSDYGLLDHGTIAGVTLVVDAAADGRYDVEVWRTRDTGGRAATIEATASGGRLPVALPAFERDIALKLRRRN